MARFKHQAIQADRRTVDIGAHGTEETTLIGARDYSIYEPFLLIECKRLPADRKEREREYVTGTYRSGSPSGGIQRFKLGLHGQHVETAAMVGYIQQQSPQHWHAAINGWIAALVGQHCSDGCIWRNADQLQSLNVTDEIGLSECLSSHERTGNCVTPCVTIYHFWVYMSHPSEREAWLYENAEALGKVRRGLKQARAKKFAADPPDLHAAAELAQDLVDV